MAAARAPRRGSGKRSSLTAVALAALASSSVLLVLVLPGASAFGMPPGLAPDKVPPAVPSDIPLVKCQVCRLVIKEAARLADDLRKEAAAKPGKKFEEADVIEKLERICAPLDDAGEWATRVDFVESAGSSLKVVDTGKPSRCNSECATAARACEQAADAIDLSDVSEGLYAGNPLESIAREACGEEGDGEAKACSEAAPPPPKGRAPGPKHEPMSERDAGMAKMMRQLKASGLGGQMFDREQLMKSKKAMKGLGGAMGGGMGVGDDDEEDEEEEEGEGAGIGAAAGGGAAAAPASALAAGAAAKVDELASKAKETLGGGIKWLKSKVAGGEADKAGEL